MLKFTASIIGIEWIPEDVDILGFYEKIVLENFF